MYYRLRTPTLVAAVHVAASSAFGVTIFGIDNLGSFNGGTVGDRLVSFDSADPSVVAVIGDTGIANGFFTGLDFDAAGTLYGYGVSSEFAFFLPLGLYEIDTATGVATFIGDGGLDDEYIVDDLSFDPVSGVMHATAHHVQTGENQMYTIDLETGVAALIGAVVGKTTPLNVGLGTNASGQQFVHDIEAGQMFQLAGVNATALSNVVGFNAAFSQGMTIDWDGDDSWWLGGFNVETFQAELWLVDELTGVGTFIGAIGPATPMGGTPEHQLGDIAIAPEIVATCLGDLNGDGIVNTFDLSFLLGSWTSGQLIADLSGDGQYSGADLALLLGAWGPCS